MSVDREERLRGGRVYLESFCNVKTTPSRRNFKEQELRHKVHLNFQIITKLLQMLRKRIVNRFQLHLRIDLSSGLFRIDNRPLGSYRAELISKREAVSP
ncbi:hypothetical protein CEE69_23695 [Rhodopirellula bahusiensis]|uniref:Uncharacterized protein n=1 Tax=Rhodopirellula bahusiensis TaxID=2014065 RepID=A0A2G1W196_9BACT|nr:hypothetical protein CEE69_23695 [Rhodopirellula bahusiensis]